VASSESFSPPQSEDFHGNASALERNAFFGPDSWYMNAERNMAFAREAKSGGRLSLPVLFGRVVLMP